MDDELLYHLLATCKKSIGKQTEVFVDDRTSNCGTEQQGKTQTNNALTSGYFDMTKGVFVREYKHRNKSFNGF